MFYPTAHPGQPRSEPSLVDEMRQSMAERPRAFPPGLALDAVGHALFARVTALPGYSLARAESELLRMRGDEILTLAGNPTDLVDLRAGTSVSVRSLLGRADRYVAIEPCRPVLDDSVESLRSAYPGIDVRGVCGDGPASLALLNRTHGPRLILALGGTLGRLDASAIRLELWRTRAGMAPEDRLLIGLDLDKETYRLLEAYNDPDGVYTSFARNAFRRANRDFGTDFDAVDWRPVVEMQRGRGRIEVRFEAKRPVRVRGGSAGDGWSFGTGEPLIVEHAYKFSEGQIAALALGAGFTVVGVWNDAPQGYGLFMLAPKKA